MVILVFHDPVSKRQRLQMLKINVRYQVSRLGKYQRMTFPQEEDHFLQLGHHYVKAELEEMVFFLRKGRALVLAEAANRVADVDFGHLQALTFGDGAVEYEYYHDDGYTKDYENPKNWSRLEISGDGEISC